MFILSFWDLRDFSPKNVDVKLSSTPISFKLGFETYYASEDSPKKILWIFFLQIFFRTFLHWIIWNVGKKMFIKIGTKKNYIRSSRNFFCWKKIFWGKHFGKKSLTFFCVFLSKAPNPPVRGGLWPPHPHRELLKNL